MVLLVIGRALPLSEGWANQGDEGQRCEMMTVHRTVLSWISGQLNLPWTVLPVGVLICTAPFGSAGRGTLAVPVSRFSPAGAKSMRSGLPSIMKMAAPLYPSVFISLSA